MVDVYIKFIKAHETILLLVLAAAVIWGVSGKIENVIAKHDKSNETQAQIVATAQAQKDAAIAAQVATDKAAFDALQAKVTAQNAALVQVNVALATALTKQQKTDDTMTSTELVNRWNVLVPNAQASSVAGGVSLPDNGAHATVDQLEEVPALKQSVVDDQKQIENDVSLITAEQAGVKDLTSQVTGLNLQIVDNSKVCDARVKVETDKIHKARRRWFEFGFVTGFLARQIIKTEAGI